MTASIPPPSEFLDAILRILSRHPSGIARKDIHEPVADLMRLSAEQRAIWLPSGKHLTYRHRIGWAFNMLKHAGLARSIAFGVWGITDTGAKLVHERPEGLTEHDRRDIARQSRESAFKEGGSEELLEHRPSPIADPDQTPEERIDAALDSIRREVSRELLALIGQSSPAFFETLVLDLLHALGYGASRDDLQRVGRSGDGGIDGIIPLDKLGLEKVYVQAKRWQNNVGRPEIQAFRGALEGHHARKGVFITTAGYTRDAKAYATNVSDCIVLVDGPHLARLMIDHGVGINHDRTVIIPSIDRDYFDDA